MLVPGDMLAGRYRLGEVLGAGGMATVYRATDVRLHRAVAVKVLATHRATDPAAGERFLREARAMAALSHPAIVAIYDVEWSAPGGEHGPFLVMELVEGGTLADRLAVEGRVPPAEVAALVDAVASALASMHAAGLVHRDVKPRNILLGASGPKLADLGVVRLTDPATAPASDLTTPDTTMGTLRYLAPEVIAGEAAGPAADAFALALVAFEALTGQPARPAVSLATLSEVADRAIARVSGVAPDLGTSFDGAFEEALRRDPRRRSTVPAFARALREATATAIRRPAPVPASAMSQVSPDDPTVIVAPVRPAAGPAPAAGAWAAPPAATTAAVDLPRRRGLPAILAGLIVLALGIAALALFLPGLAPGRGPASEPSASAPAVVPSESASPAASPEPGGSAVAPSAPPTPEPTPKPTVDALDQAISELRVAIAAARGAGDLKGKQVNDLFDRVARIEAAIRAGDLADAGTRARELASQVRKLADKGDVDGQEAARLVAAADALAELLPAG